MIGIRIPTAASLLIFSSAAFAADLPVYTGQEPEPLPISQYFDWTGFYVGAHLGWGFGDQEFPAACECGAGSDAELDYDGLLGGLQIGYNYQFRPNWLVGIEGDISWSDISGSGTTTMPNNIPPDTATFTSTIDWFGTLRGRLGYVFDRWMVYGTGGLAYGSYETRYNVTYPGADPGIVVPLSGTMQDKDWGWTVGAGAEFAFTDRWSVKAEYLYVDLGGGGKTIYSPENFEFFSETDDFKFHTVRLGVNYHF